MKYACIGMLASLPLQAFFNIMPEYKSSDEKENAAAPVSKKEKPQEQKKRLPPQKEAYIATSQKMYGGKKDDVARGIVRLENGHSAIVGTCKSYEAERTDICVTRMNEKGDMEWRLWLGGEKEDEGKAISRASDGSIFVLGWTKSLAKNYDKDIYVAKVSLEGKLIWEKAIGGERDEYAGGIAGTDDGGAVVVGDSESFGKGSYKDIYIAKLDKNGNTVSARTVGGKKTEEAHALTRLRDGNLALVGMREVKGGNYEDFFLMKLDQNGKKIWARTYGAEDYDALRGVAPTIDGGLVAVGETRSYGSEQTDLTVMKFTGDGKLIWHKIYGFKYYEYGNAVAMTRDGGFMLVGGTNTLGKGDHDAYVLALDRNGELIWSHAYGEKGRDVAHGVARLSDGTMMIVGETDSYTNATNFHIIKLKKQ